MPHPSRVLCDWDGDFDFRRAISRRAQHPTSRQRRETWGTPWGGCKQSRDGFLGPSRFCAGGWGNLWCSLLNIPRAAETATRLIAVLLNPDADLLFDGEASSDGTGEAGLQRKGMRFERHGEMEFGVGEAAHEQVDVTVQA